MASPAARDRPAGSSWYVEAIWRTSTGDRLGQSEPKSRAHGESSEPHGVSSEVALDRSRGQPEGGRENDARIYPMMMGTSANKPFFMSLVG